MFDSALATKDDIKVHKVEYEVKKYLYPLHPAEGFFDVKIIGCPNILTTATEDITYDLDQGKVMTVTPAEITFEPRNCLSISTYVVSDANGAVPAYITVTGTKISIQSQDESLVESSPHTLNLTAKLSDGQ